MIIDIHRDTTVRHLQGQFAARYPYLKLVFLFRDAAAGQLGEVPADHCIAAVPLQKKVYTLKIDPADTIADVELSFSNIFDLNARVLQQSQGHWIDPGGKGKLSISAQNAAGEAAADHVIHPDYDSHIEKRDN